MADIAVRCTFQSASGLERHNAINTWAVTGADPGVDDQTITDLFDIFYNQVDTDTSLSITQHINDTIMRTGGLVIELVDSPNVVPNVPYFTAQYDINPALSAPLPQEMALCLSFVDAVYVEAINPGRHRGRVYLGPLTLGSMTDSGTNLPARPFSGFIDCVAHQAELLGTGLQADSKDWAIWSRAANEFYPVARGWVDNEFDVQRRREWGSTGKNFWSL